MTVRLLAAVVVASGSLLAAQEGRKIPDDSLLVKLQGCATGRTFIVGPRSEHAPGTLEIEQGRRFRLNGPGKVLDQIKRDEDHMVEVTGLIRKSDVAKPGGIGLAGGRVRIGGGPPRATLGNNPAGESVYNQAVIDVESSRPLPEPCPAR
jgi:hypothetical protein